MQDSFKIIKYGRRYTKNLVLELQFKCKSPLGSKVKGFNILDIVVPYKEMTDRFITIFS